MVLTNVSISNMNFAGDISKVMYDNSSGEINISSEDTLKQRSNVGNLSQYIDFSNIDYSMIDYPSEVKVVPLWEIIVKISVYVIITLFALVGNILIIVVVVRNKRMRTTTNFYIINLAVSDLLVTLCCTWVNVVDDLTDGWVLGSFFCKINSFAQVCSLVSSTITLTLIACDRFFGIVFALKAHIIERKACNSIVVVWIISLAVSSPMAFVRTNYVIEWKNHVESWCDDDWPREDMEHGRGWSPSRRAYYVIISLLLYFIPMVVMSCIYSLIIIKVWFAKSPGERVSSDLRVQSKLKKKVLVMLMMILATFCLCWLPLQVDILYTEFRNDHTPLSSWYFHFTFFAKTLAFSNSAFNPIIYAGFNENFRKGFRSLFGCYERKLYATISRVDSMYNSSTNMTKM